MNYFDFFTFLKDPEMFVPKNNTVIFPKLKRNIVSNGTGQIELEMNGEKNNSFVIFMHHFNILYSERSFYLNEEYRISRDETIEILSSYFPLDYETNDIKEPDELV